MKKIAVNDFLVFAIKNYVRKMEQPEKPVFHHVRTIGTFENLK